MTTRFFNSALVCFAVLVSFQVKAVTLLTPRLENSTRLSLLAKLAKIGFPEAGQNSVVISISSALGFQASDSQDRSELPYVHIPNVIAISTKLSDQCATIKAVATGKPNSSYRTTTVTGTYCLVGASEWKSVDQLVNVEAQ
ncbi:hypothetical protein I1E95_06655 [Synechococcus sp. CBW1107]|jgi:hypothetical protein|uniref:hypothetical protein n=1 Tax=Synechococcus sp. CBW1107 TaxID=2789857 RepID=UPI0018CE2196|nr:hypothetical protein [Synechococcus sp. CBW1107]QPN57744.1 hypothetical protein I1E95_06655 [Synechococcus sp. CBW1107]CAK6687055.1 hypothetical protein BBFGKLBO_00136 [Synechococcus sp. CBW1107]